MNKCRLLFQNILKVNILPKQFKRRGCCGQIFGVISKCGGATLGLVLALALPASYGPSPFAQRCSPSQNLKHFEFLICTLTKRGNVTKIGSKTLS